MCKEMSVNTAERNLLLPQTNSNTSPHIEDEPLSPASIKVLSPKRRERVPASLCQAELLKNHQPTPLGWEGKGKVEDAE